MTQYEALVASGAGQDEIHDWVRRNAQRRYVPEGLLVELGIVVNSERGIANL